MVNIGVCVRGTFDIFSTLIPKNVVCFNFRTLKCIAVELLRDSADALRGIGLSSHPRFALRILASQFES